MARIGGNQPNQNRDKNDFYPTHPHWTATLLNVVKFDGPVWEPACGQGHMVKVIEGFGYKVRSTDIVTGDDFLKCSTRWEGDIITNPPYRLLDEFIEKAIELASGRVAMLMPIGALGGKNRLRKLWTVTPPEVVLIIASRMPVNEKTSQFNHVWAVFNAKETAKSSKIVWSE